MFSWQWTRLFKTNLLNVSHVKQPPHQILHLPYMKGRKSRLSRHLRDGKYILALIN